MSRVPGSVYHLDFDLVVSEVLYPVGPDVPPADHQDFGDACVVDELGAHDARLSSANNPGSSGGHSVRRSVADDVHFGVVAADLNLRSGFDGRVAGYHPVDPRLGLSLLTIGELFE